MFSPHVDLKVVIARGSLHDPHANTPYSEMIGMSVEQTQQTPDRYFDLTGRDEDFAECLTADVSWVIADTGGVVQGPDAVRDHIIALHTSNGGHSESRTRRRRRLRLPRGRLRSPNFAQVPENWLVHRLRHEG